MRNYLESVCILGAGRMGSAIAALLPSNVKIYQYSRLYANNLESFTKDLQRCDGVIDISHINNIEPALKACLNFKKPYLCCTTGLEESHFNTLKTAAKNLPVLYAANTSFGIAVLKKAVAIVAKSLGQDTDITISETHHNLKKDAPSGTALELGKVITQAGHPKDLINYASLRGGNVVGEHTVHFFHEDEIIRLSHECLNRDVFAKGAIKAANWLFKQQPGFYGLNDMLEL